MKKEVISIQEPEKNLSNKEKNKNSKVIFYVEKNSKDIKIKANNEIKNNNIKEDYISTDSSPKKVFIINGNSKDSNEEYLEIKDNQPEIKIKLDNSKKENKDNSVIELLETISDERENLEQSEKNKNINDIIIPIFDEKKKEKKISSHFKKSYTVPFKRFKSIKKSKDNEPKTKKKLECILIENKKEDSFWKSMERKNNQINFLNKKRKKKDIGKSQRNNKKVKTYIFKKSSERAIEKIKEKVKEKEEIEKNNIIQKNKNEIEKNKNEKYLKDLITDLLEGKYAKNQQKGKEPSSKLKDENIDKKFKIFPQIEIKKDGIINAEKKSSELTSVNNTINEEMKTNNLDSKNTLYNNDDIIEKIPSNSSSNRETSFNNEESREEYGMQTLLSLINNNGLEKIINYLCLDNIEKNYEIEEKLNSLKRNYGELKLIAMILKICLFNKKEKYENQNRLKNENEKKSDGFKYEIFEKNIEEKMESLKQKISKLIFSEFGFESDNYNVNKNKNYIPKYFRDKIHSIVRMKGNKQSCYFCNKDKIDYFCENCKVPIHLHCFKNYHNNFIYS